jgi:hypothetical protein
VISIAQKLLGSKSHGIVKDLPFLREGGRTYAYNPLPGELKSTALPEPHQVPIFDARLIAGGLSLDREDFALVRHPTAVKNFYDDKEIRNVYYPAAQAFLTIMGNPEEIPACVSPNEMRVPRALLQW